MIDDEKIFLSQTEFLLWQFFRKDKTHLEGSLHRFAHFVEKLHPCVT